MELTKGELGALIGVASGIGVLVVFGFIRHDINLFKTAVLVAAGLASYHITVWRRFREQIRAR